MGRPENLPGSLPEGQARVRRGERDFVNQLIGKIAHFLIDPINREVTRFETEIKRQVQRLPEVQALEQGMERAKELLDDLENEITEEALAGQCAKVLRGSTRAIGGCRKPRTRCEDRWIDPSSIRSALFAERLNATSATAIRRRTLEREHSLMQSLTVFRT